MYGQVAVELYIQARARSSKKTIKEVALKIISNARRVQQTRYPGEQQYTSYLQLLLSEHQLTTVIIILFFYKIFILN